MSAICCLLIVSALIALSYGDLTAHSCTLLSSTWDLGFAKIINLECASVPGQFSGAKVLFLDLFRAPQDHHQIPIKFHFNQCTRHKMMM